MNTPTLTLMEALLNTDFPFAEKIYAVRIDDEVKMITPTSATMMGKTKITKFHNEIYPKARYEVEVYEMLNCPNNMFIYGLISNDYGFLNKPEIDLKEMQKNLQQIAASLRFFKVDLNNPIQTKNEDNNKFLPATPVGLFFPGEINESSRNTLMNPMPIKQMVKETLLSELKPGQEPIPVEAYNGTSGDLYELSANIFPDLIPTYGNMSYRVYYNVHFNTAIVVEETSGISEVQLTMFPELRVQYEVDHTKTQEIEELKKLLMTKTFEDEYDCKQFLDNILFKKPTKISTEDIKKQFNKIYQITDDVNEKMKFSEIYNKLQESMKLNEENSVILKKNLPNILLEMGLQKKRYSDAIYYFGCVEKIPVLASTKNNTAKETRSYGFDIIDVNKNNPENVDQDEDVDDKQPQPAQDEDVDDKVIVKKI